MTVPSDNSSDVEVPVMDGAGLVSAVQAPVGSLRSSRDSITAETAREKRRDRRVRTTGEKQFIRSVQDISRALFESRISRLAKESHKMRRGTTADSAGSIRIHNDLDINLAVKLRIDGMNSLESSQIPAHRRHDCISRSLLGAITIRDSPPEMAADLPK